MSYTLTAVWGSPGAGKTTLSLALGAALAKKKQDVLILSLDQQTPMLPVYLPGAQLSHANSLGSLLDLPGAFSESDFGGRIHKHPGSGHLFFAGLSAGETIGLTYKPPLRQRIDLLMEHLRHMPFDHVLVDCQSTPIFDALTLYALEFGRHVLRVCTPDVRGYEAVAAQLAWMGNNPALQVDRHIRVGNLFYHTTPAADAAALHGGFACTLPWSHEVYDRYSAGQLLHRFAAPDGLVFEEAITHLAHTVTEGGTRLAG